MRSRSSTREGWPDNRRTCSIFHLHLAGMRSRSSTREGWPDDRRTCSIFQLHLVSMRSRSSTIENWPDEPKTYSILHLHLEGIMSRSSTRKGWLDDRRTCSIFHLHLEGMMRSRSRWRQLCLPVWEQHSHDLTHFESRTAPLPRPWLTEIRYDASQLAHCDRAVPINEHQTHSSRTLGRWRHL